MPLSVYFGHQNDISVTHVLVVVATLLVHPSSGHNILMIPLVARSHVFAMAAMADGLADLNHTTTIVVPSIMPIDKAEVEMAARRGIRYDRYDDDDSNGGQDFDAAANNMTRMVMENGMRMDELLPIIVAR